MKFLLDQGLPRSTVQHLQDMGIEAEHVGRAAQSRGGTWLASAGARVHVAFIIIVHRACGILASRVEA